MREDFEMKVLQEGTMVLLDYAIVKALALDDKIVASIIEIATI